MSDSPPSESGWRLLARHVRPHRLLLLGALALGLVGTAAELTSPLVTRAVLGSLESGDPVLGLAVLLVVVLLAGDAIGYAQTVLLGSMAERVIGTARRGMLGSLLGARVEATRTGGEMASRVTSDTTLIREAATSSLVYLVNGSVSLVGSVILMAYLDAVLLAVTVSVLAVAAVLTMALMPPLARLQQQVQDQLGMLGGRLDGVTRAIRTVKASRAEDRELGRLEQHVDRAAALGRRAVRIEAAAWTLTGVGINLVVVVVLGLGAYRVSIGAIDVPTLVAYLLYVFGLMWPAMMLTMSITSLQSGIAAAVRIAEVTTLPQETDAPGATDEPAPAPGAPMLALEELVVRYGPDLRAALDGVSLEVPRTGHVALIGPSGAGKTTVMSALLRFLEPESGRILLQGVPYDEWTRAAVRRRVAYVEQDTPVVPGTLRENVVHAVPDAGDDQVWAVLAQVGLAERAQALPRGLDTDIAATTLSGGERQRVAIARALLARPDVLLLDEATAQLDGITEAAVTTAVRELARRGAVVSIAHRLSTVMDADQIVVLEEGRIRATGTHDELLAGDQLYADLVAALRIGPLQPEPEPESSAAAGAPHR